MCAAASWSGDTIEPLDCNEVVEPVTEFLDGGVDQHAELRFANHVRHCIGCSRQLRHVERTIRGSAGRRRVERREHSGGVVLPDPRVQVVVDGLVGPVPRHGPVERDAEQ